MSSKAFALLIASLELDVKKFVHENKQPVEDSVFFLEEKGTEIMRTIFSKEEKIEASAITASMLYQAIILKQKDHWNNLPWSEKFKVLFLGRKLWR